MRYADLDNLIADYIPEATSDEEVAAIGRILNSVSAFVDSYCRRPAGYFYPAPVVADAPTPGQIKRVRGEGHHFLRLPVHIFGTVESVTLDGSVIDSSLFYESEKNGWLYLEESNFYSERRFNEFDIYRFWYDRSIYKVTARWGYEVTPLPVVEAVRLIVARIWSVQKGTIGQVTAEGFIQEKLIPQAAKDLLKMFIRREFEI